MLQISVTGRISLSGEASSELKLSLTVHPARLASGPTDDAARSSDQHRSLARPLQGPPCRGSSAPRLLQGCGSTALPLWLDDCICSFLFRRQTNHCELSRDCKQDAFTLLQSQARYPKAPLLIYRTPSARLVSPGGSVVEFISLSSV